MNYQKGDLILIKKLDNTSSTCIVIGCFTGSEYLYCYGVEDDKYRLVYFKEVECILSKGFAPDFPENDFFDLDYSFYAACYEAYQYYPSYITPDDDEDEEK
tara:strand:- start:3545 stop:3847 length:303 start_codon:yes stop_codon:yes gene_type:complete